MMNDGRDATCSSADFCDWRRLARQFADDRSGATALEYALLVALISVSIILALVPTGQSVSNVLMDVASGIADDAPAAPSPAASPPAPTPAATPPSSPKKKKKKKKG